MVSLLTSGSTGRRRLRLAVAFPGQAPREA